MSGGPFLDWKQYILCTKNQVEDTRLEPCDWPASFASYVPVSGFKRARYTWICLHGFQLFFTDLEPIRGRTLLCCSLHAPCTNATPFSVRYCGKRPTFATISPDRDPPHPHKYMNLLVEGLPVVCWATGT